MQEARAMFYQSTQKLIVLWLRDQIRCRSCVPDCFSVRTVNARNGTIDIRNRFPSLLRRNFPSGLLTLLSSAPRASIIVNVESLQQPTRRLLFGQFPPDLITDCVGFCGPSFCAAWSIVCSLSLSPLCWDRLIDGMNQVPEGFCQIRQRRSWKTTSKMHVTFCHFQSKSLWLQRRRLPTRRRLPWSAEEFRSTLRRVAKFTWPEGATLGSSLTSSSKRMGQTDLQKSLLISASNSGFFSSMSPRRSTRRRRGKSPTGS